MVWPIMIAGASSRAIEFLSIRLPALANPSHYALVLRIGAQTIVVLVALEPGIIHASYLDCAFQPIEGGLAVAEQGIDSAEPVGFIAIDDLSRTILKQSGVDLLPLLARVEEKRRHQPRPVIARVARERDRAIEITFSLVEFAFVIKHHAEAGQGLELIRVLRHQRPQFGFRLSWFAGV